MDDSMAANIWFAISDLLIKLCMALCFLQNLIEELEMEVNDSRKRKREVRYSLIGRMPQQAINLEKLLSGKEIDCKDNIRIFKPTFERLCQLLQEVGGLQDSRYVTVREQVAMFLKIVSHHDKNRIVRYEFGRSGHTVSRYFNRVLHAILKVHPLLLSNPEPIPSGCTDPVWQCFEGCLGALDGTYVEVDLPLVDQPRYRSRKGQISTNVLAVCDMRMQYVYMLAGWEGSAADGRVLRSAIARQDGFKVPTGTFIEGLVKKTSKRRYFGSIKVPRA